MKYYEILDRSIISISGIEAKNFLQSLITNDINKVSDSNSIYSCMLTPQGKYIFDFFISYFNNQYLIDIAKDRYRDFIEKINLYKLRKKININYEEDYIVINIQNSDSDIIGFTENYLSGIRYIDPRDYRMGYRSVIKNNDIENINFNKSDNNYNKNRINLFIPEKDLVVDKSFPLEFGLDKLNALDFKKGCYIGQEVTARTKYRGVIRKSIYKIESQNDLEFGEIFIDNQRIGVITSIYKNIGLALIRDEDYLNSSCNYPDSKIISNDQIIKLTKN